MIAMEKQDQWGFFLYMIIFSSQCNPIACLNKNTLKFDLPCLFHPVSNGFFVWLILFSLQNLHFQAVILFHSAKNHLINTVNANASHRQYSAYISKHFFHVFTPMKLQSNFILTLYRKIILAQSQLANNE